MSNGFYDHTIFKIDSELKIFLTKAIQTSFYCEVEWIKNWRREICNSLTVSDYLQNYISINHHISIVDRFAYNGGASWADKIGEVVVSNIFDVESKMLWIKLDLDKFHELINEFNLELKTY